MNELLLAVSVVFIFGTVLLAYMLFGRCGLYAVSSLAAVFANIEAIILIKAFGMEQTLGNVLFAATFLATDILSECESRAAANKAVYIGLFSTLFFIALSQSWMLYSPIEGDASDAISQIFTQTPRIAAASVAVYLISQLFDVWLYHKWWNFTQKKSGDRKRYLWLRNNGSTLISQLLNSLLFTVCAFAGKYDFTTLISIFGSSYVIYIFTSLLDTPVLYLARRYRSGRTMLKGYAE